MALSLYTCTEEFLLICWNHACDDSYLLLLLLMLYILSVDVSIIVLASCYDAVVADDDAAVEKKWSFKWLQDAILEILLIMTFHYQFCCAFFILL